MTAAPRMKSTKAPPMLMSSDVSGLRSQRCWLLLDHRHDSKPFLSSMLGLSEDLTRSPCHVDIIVPDYDIDDSTGNVRLESTKEKASRGWCPTEVILNIGRKQGLIAPCLTRLSINKACDGLVQVRWKLCAWLLDHGPGFVACTSIKDLSLSN